VLYVLLGEFGFSLSEVEKFGEKNVSIDQIKSVALEQHLNPLDDFALKCRSELRTFYAGAGAGWGPTRV
jgi:hypothetical protein